MQIILFDSSARYLDLLPLTYTRPIAALRCGILTLAEKWEKRINEKVAYLTENYLQEKFIYQTKTDNLYINSSNYLVKIKFPLLPFFILSASQIIYFQYLIYV